MIKMKNLNLRFEINFVVIFINGLTAKFRSFRLFYVVRSNFCHGFFIGVFK